MQLSDLMRRPLDIFVLLSRFAFGFLVFVMAYVCWLLVKYYQSYVILRQHYLMGGEKQINEWHQQFLDSQKVEESEKPTSRTRSSRRTLFGDINRVFNPNIQASAQAAPSWQPWCLDRSLPET